MQPINYTTNVHTLYLNLSSDELKKKSGPLLSFRDRWYHFRDGSSRFRTWGIIFGTASVVTGHERPGVVVVVALLVVVVYGSSVPACLEAQELRRRWGVLPEDPWVWSCWVGRAVEQCIHHKDHSPGSIHLNINLLFKFHHNVESSTSSLHGVLMHFKT